MNRKCHVIELPQSKIKVSGQSPVASLERQDQIVDPRKADCIARHQKPELELRKSKEGGQTILSPQRMLLKCWHGIGNKVFQVGEHLPVQQ